MKYLGNELQKQLPGLGFALFVFPLLGPWTANYISNGQREDMIRMLEETLDRFKNNRIIETPNGN